MRACVRAVDDINAMHPERISEVWCHLWLTFILISRAGWSASSSSDQTPLPISTGLQV